MSETKTIISHIEKEIATFEAEIAPKIEAIEAERKSLLEKLSQTFKPLFDSFFAAYPDVKKIGWTQYTPYFNDGDECTFGVNEFSFTTLTDEELDGEESWLWDGIPGYEYDKTTYKDIIPLQIRSYYLKEQPKLTVEMVEDFRALAGAMKKIDTEFYKALFGDHAKVLVDREGIKVEEYDHD